MPALFFDLTGVQILIDHAKSTPAGQPRRLSYEQAYDPAFALPGLELPSEDGMLAEALHDDQVDWSKVEPGLQLIKDSGVYLMSNGLPQLDMENPHRVLYARGLGADAEHEDMEYYTGSGDDFVVDLPVTMFRGLNESDVIGYRITIRARSILVKPALKRRAKPKQK